MPIIYLDYNATQPLKPAVRDAMLARLGAPGNASSVHRLGQAARHVVEAARAQVAQLIGAEAEEIVFTSGATEANAAVIQGFAPAPLLVSAIEHPSVLGAAQNAVRVPVDRHGVIDLDALARMLAESGAALVSIMLVNNETGVIQPVAEAVRIAHGAGARVHCDATQAPGRIAIDVEMLGIDYLTLSAHKIGGPQGVGALYIRDGAPFRPLLAGGGQERRRRAGTENVAGIAGFGVAAALAVADFDTLPRLAALRDGLEHRLRKLCPDLVIHGAAAPRVGNTSCFGAPGLPAEIALIALDLAGIAVSSGAACSSGAVEPSHVLQAMGIAPTCGNEAIRVSLGWATESGDIDRLVDVWAGIYERNRARTRLALARSG